MHFSDSILNNIDATRTNSTDYTEEYMTMEL